VSLCCVALYTVPFCKVALRGVVSRCCIASLCCFVVCVVVLCCSVSCSPVLCCVVLRGVFCCVALCLLHCSAARYRVVLGSVLCVISCCVVLCCAVLCCVVLCCVFSVSTVLLLCCIVWLALCCVVSCNVEDRFTVRSAALWHRAV